MDRVKRLAAWGALILGAVLTPLAYLSYYQERMSLPGSAEAGYYRQKLRARGAELRLFGCLAITGAGALYLLSHLEKRS